MQVPLTFIRALSYIHRKHGQNRASYMHLVRAILQYCVKCARFFYVSGKESLYTKKSAQNSKVLHFDFHCGHTKWKWLRKPSVCNLAVSVLKSRKGFRNVVLAAEEEMLFVESQYPQFPKYSLSCLNPISTIQIIHKCPVASAWPVYFKLTRKRNVFLSKPHWKATVCYAKPHNGWLAEV